jgi:hypothetical protein
MTKSIFICVMFFATLTCKDSNTSISDTKFKDLEYYLKKIEESLGSLSKWVSNQSEGKNFHKILEQINLFVANIKKIEDDFFKIKNELNDHLLVNSWGMCVDGQILKQLLSNDENAKIIAADEVNRRLNKWREICFDQQAPLQKSICQLN